MSNPEGSFDVIICGAGLAGLTLARQLRMTFPHLSILMIEKAPRPLPVACLKVGESSVEVGTHYFTQILKLADYFKQAHLPKLGLRFFFGDSQGPLDRRPEFGVDRFPTVPSYQIDRGILENDLRQMNVDDGVLLLEDCTVKDIVLSEGDGPHEVLFERKGEVGPQVVRGRWVVDATGRRRLLQGKLNLKRENGHEASAAWFRVQGRIDIDDLVPPSRHEWHERVPGRIRYYSTNHLMGRGYWVWLIPLGSGNTSVGIVTSEKIHPVHQYSTYELAFQWLRKHEPRLAAHLAGREPMDFLAYKRYSYSSHRVFSEHRWACVGEAGVFTDPFYSPGSDFIAMGNTIVTEMVQLDREGQLTDGISEGMNALFMSINDSFVDLYRDSYDIFGVTHVMSAKVLWDWAAYWAFMAQLFFQRILTRHDLLPRVFEIGMKYFALNQRVQQLFRDWGARTTSKDTFEFLDPFTVPLVHELHLDLRNPKSEEQALADTWRNLERLEDLAVVLFHRAVEETAPDTLSRAGAPLWVNPYAISLSPDQWAGDGLFATSGAPRDPTWIREQLRVVLG